MEPTAMYRYPGVNYFTKKDKAVFCGRQDDVDALYTQVMINRTLVLHGESGTGKSSLLQAGFLPLLEDRQNESAKLDAHFSKFLPITIRFDFLRKTTEGVNKESLIEDTVAMIKHAFPQLNAIKLPHTKGINQDSLWCIGKKMAVQKIKPLLIFDQFEELQGYPVETIAHFKRELAELLSTEMPKPVYEAMKKMASELCDSKTATEQQKNELNETIAFFEKPIDAKAIFVVREDRLGTMSLLSDYFPNILKNDFLLSPLSIKNACLALTEPAKVKGDFRSPPFVFESEGLVTKLITEIADAQTALVDPIQVQIIATKIERNCIEKASSNRYDDENPCVVTAADIPNLGDVINEFYSNCWNSIKANLNLSDAEYESKRNKITGVLVINDRRDLVNSGWIIDSQNPETDQKIINGLLATGLLRVVPYGKVKYYQLCHDRFISPVANDQQKYEAIKKELENEKLKRDLKSEREAALITKELYKKIKTRNKIAIITACVCLIIGLLSLSLWRQANEEREKNLVMLKRLVRTYVTNADIEIQDKEFGLAKAYLNKAKEFLKDNQTDTLYLEIDQKLKDIEEKQQAK
jgi:hypothetical protein